jgi:hypothetical protein
VTCNEDAELEYASDEIVWVVRAQMRVNEDQDLERTLQRGTDRSRTTLVGWAHVQRVNESSGPNTRRAGVRGGQAKGEEDRGAVLE